MIVLAFGCATTTQDAMLSEQRPRQTFHYSNSESFELEHQNAFPRVLDPSRPSEITDGTLTGLLCGVPVQYDARWFAGTLTLSGYGDIQWQNYPRLGGPATLTLGISEPAPGHRKISGQFGGHIFADSSSPIVDLDVSADQLQGRVGNEQFSLAAKGDYLVGQTRRDGAAAPYAIYGRNVLPTMPPAAEGLTLVAMLACSGQVVEYANDEVRGFALAKLERPKGAIPEHDAEEPDDSGDAELEPEPPADATRSIEPANVATTIKALRDYKDKSAIVYLPRNPSKEMSAIGDSLVDIFRRAGFSVEQKLWRAQSCRRPKYDLALIANQPATTLELGIGVRLTLTKLAVYVCQSANAEPDKLGVLVLPPRR